MNETTATGKAEPAPSTTPPPPDITRDRLVIVGGASMVAMHDAMHLPSDNVPAWVTLVPIEDNQAEKVAKETGLPYWPRERHFRVLHEMLIGTVDELVADYRAKMIRCFETFAGKNRDGSWDVIPTFGEASLRKQTEVLERNGFNKDMTGQPLKCTPQQLLDRDATRNKQRGYTNRQNAFDRDSLMRLVATWGNKRFSSPDELGYSSLSSPTDNPTSVQKLIDALTTLRDDHYRADDIYYATAHGVTRDTFGELARRFKQRHKKEPTVLKLTAAQLTEISLWPQKSSSATEEWYDFGTPGSKPKMLVGMKVEVFDYGPILE